MTGPNDIVPLPNNTDDDKVFYITGTVDLDICHSCSGLFIHDSIILNVCN
jgi:hypothetical protein